MRRPLWAQPLTVQMHRQRQLLPRRLPLLPLLLLALLCPLRLIRLVLSLCLNLARCLQRTGLDAANVALCTRQRRRSRWAALTSTRALRVYRSRALRRNSCQRRRKPTIKPHLLCCVASVLSTALSVRHRLHALSPPFPAVRKPSRNRHPLRLSTPPHLVALLLVRSGDPSHLHRLPLKSR